MRINGPIDAARWRQLRVGFALLLPAGTIMVLMLALPFLALVLLSFWRQSGFDIDPTLTAENYIRIFAPSDQPTVWNGIPFYLAYPVPLILLFKSLMMALTATLAVILLAYPMAYFIAFRIRRGKAVWILLLTIPFWTSYLLRVFSWKVVLGYNGAINSGLVALGIIDKPLDFLLYTSGAVTVTLAHSWVAFAVMPIYVSLEKIDRNLLDAASDLGDSRWQRFRRITWPLSLPGTIAATLMVFIPTVGDYVTPTLVGGPSGTMIGNLIQDMFLKRNNAPMGAAVAIVMMAVIGLLALLVLWASGFRRLRARLK
ncbi:ABC transporter permease [Albidovulum sp.]